MVRCWYYRFFFYRRPRKEARLGARRRLEVLEREEASHSPASHLPAPAPNGRILDTGFTFCQRESALPSLCSPPVRVCVGANGRVNWYKKGG
jgi:hypothetical protein